MQITLTLNDKKLTADVAPDTLLIDFVRSHGCLSVKRGCETSNCGLCTVFLDDKPVLSCSVLAARADGHKVTTLEGLQDEAAEFGAFIADQGAEQCGFCNPGFIMNALALFREKEYPTDEEIKEYLSGNLCRCSGYEGQLRGILCLLLLPAQRVQLVVGVQGGAGLGHLAGQGIQPGGVIGVAGALSFCGIQCGPGGVQRGLLFGQLPGQLRGLPGGSQLLLYGIQPGFGVGKGCGGGLLCGLLALQQLLQ